MRLRTTALAFTIALSGFSLAAQLQWQQFPGGRFAELPPAPAGKPGFTLLTPAETSVTFTNFLPEPRYRTNQILLNGSGVAAADVDGDGGCDLFFCRLDGPNALYRNLGNCKFQDITESAGLHGPVVNASGAALADIDGDSDMDLIINSVGNGTRVFLNDSKGHFTPARFSPLNRNGGGTSLALADIDGDGYLDLYVANYRTSALMDMPNARFQIRNMKGQRVVATVDGRPASDAEFTNRFVVTPAGGVEELGEPDVLYHNAGGTNFVAIPFTGGTFLTAEGKPLTGPPLAWGLAAMFRDINQDGLPDLYVCNDFDSPDELWLNLGAGRFQAAPPLALRKSSFFSMAIDFADINRDGWDDFLVLDMLSRQRVSRLTTAGDRKPPISTPGEFENRPQYMMNTLFLNRGNGTYGEVAQMSGVAASEWSWAVAFLDIDLDGWEDILIANGHERAARHMDYIEQLRQLRTSRNLSPAEILESRNLFPRLATANVAFRNRRDLTFEEAGHDWGFDFVGVSNGMALADLDNDGDEDVIINNLNAAASVYRNNAPSPRVAVRLKGKPPNTFGIGARIRVTGGPVTQAQEMMAGGRYLSGDQPLRVFATGNSTNDLTIEVSWRGGTTSVVKGAKPNRLYEIDEGMTSGIPGRARLAPSLSPPPWFEDASGLLNHSHHDTAFNDFERQPLLPNKLSQLGPGVAWFDMDNDGREDLFITGGRGGKLAGFHNDPGGKLRRIQQPSFDELVARDQTAVLGWHESGNSPLIAVGSSSYEDAAPGSCARVYQMDSTNARDLPVLPVATGPMCLADIDGDGDLDLFIGGRVLAGRYPEPASSAFFRNDAGNWRSDSDKALENIGLVSGAVFSDLDGDGDPDLVLACEWGPVRVFLDDKGHFSEATAQLGLDKVVGWWNGVATGDVNNDGQIDIIASNWGRNTRYESHHSQPLRLFHGDFDGAGGIEIIEAHFDPQLGKLVPERGLDLMAKAMPFVRERFQTHEAYANASVSEVFGERLKNARELQANWLDSTVFLNRGGKFEAQSLPIEAQAAPAFGICVGDFDGDANEDIFLAQNFFATQPETPRHDAGTGLLLRGIGDGTFRALGPRESGIAVYGEQRGCAAADYDGDGRLDLVVSQNASATKLFHNVAAAPGVRVRLIGPTNNPDAIGATMRMIGASRPAATREIQAGSGYWSQNGFTQLLPPGEKLQVRWPGGKLTQTELPRGQHAIVINSEGMIVR